MIKGNHQLKQSGDDSFVFELTNEEIKKEFEKEGYKYDLNASSSEVPDDMFQIAAYKNGVNKVVWKWWGAEIWLSKTTISNIVGAGLTAGTVVLGNLMPGLGHTIMIALNVYILGVVHSTMYARAMIFGVTWNGIILYHKYQ